MKKLLKLALVMMLALTLVACGGSGSKEPDPIVGTYELTQMSASGQTMDYEGTDGGWHFEITEDGNFSMDVVSASGETSNSTGTWEKKDDGTYGLDLKGDVQEFTADGTTLKTEISGTTFVWTKTK